MLFRARSVRLANIKIWNFQTMAAMSVMQGTIVLEVLRIPAPCFGNSTSDTGRGSRNDCECNAGYQIDLEWNGCDECVEGKFKNSVANEYCTECAINTYNNLTAQFACSECPENSFVNAKGSTQISDCQCNTGYEKNIDESCSECPRNYYRSQDMVDAELDACRQCSFDSYIESMGSTSSSDCITCPVHSSRDNGGSEGVSGLYM